MHYCILFFVRKILNIKSKNLKINVIEILKIMLFKH